MRIRFKLATFLLITALCVGSGSAVIASGLAKPLVKVSVSQDYIDAKPQDTVKLVLNASDLGDFSKGANAYSGKIEYNKDFFEPLTKDSFRELNGWTQLEYNQDNDEFISFGLTRITQNTPLLEISFKVKAVLSQKDAQINIVNFMASEGSKTFDYEEQMAIAASKEAEVNVGVNISGAKEDDKSPSNGGGSQSPSNGGGSQSPSNGGGNQSPSNGGGSQSPSNGGGSQSPSNGGGNSHNNTADGNAPKPPASGGNVNQLPATDEITTDEITTDEIATDEINNSNTENNTLQNGKEEVLEETDSSVDGFDIIANDATALNTETNSTPVQSPSDESKETNIAEETNIADEIINDIEDESIASLVTNGEGTRAEFQEAESSKKSNTLLVVLVAGLSVVAVIGVSGGVFAVKRRRRNSKNDKIIRGILAVLVASAMLVTSSDIIFAMDVNGDTKVTSNDLKALEKYLIGLESIENIRKENADIDADTKLSINDLSMLITKVKDVEEAEKTDSPIGNLTGIALANSADLYPAKGSTIKLNFDAADFGSEAELSGREISAVVVNGKEYPVIKSGGKYQISIDVPETPGKSDIKIQYVVLSPATENGEETIVKLNNDDLKVSVQRSAPTISDYEIRVDKATGNATVTFTLNDPDNSIKADTLKESLQVWRTSPNSSRDGLTDLKVGANTVTFKAVNNYSYRVQIRPTYYKTKDEDIIEGNPLADNQKTATANCDQSFTYVADYGVTFTDFKAYNSINLDSSSETTSFGRNDNIFLGFSSSNTYGVALKNVTINGRSGYNLTSMEDGRYRVALGGGIFVPGRNTITINEVTLVNGSVVAVNPSIEIAIVSARPEVKAPALVETKDELRVMTEVIDRDDTFKSGTVTVSTPDGTVLLSKPISKGAPFDETILTGSSVLVSNYIVRIEGKCDLGTGEITDAFYEGTFAAIPKAVLTNAMPINSKITNEKIEKRSFEKDESFPMTYVIRHNGQASNGIERVTVNGAQISGSVNKYGDYQINLRAPKDAASEYHFVLQSVKLRGNNKEAVIVDDNNKATQNIEVLKAIPSISDYSAEGTASDSGNSVTFKFKVNDIDHAFTFGDVVLVLHGSDVSDSPAGTATYAQNDIDEEGNVTVTVANINTFTVYDVAIGAKYKRGASEDTSGEAVLNETYELIGDYKLSITEIRTYSVDDPDVEKTSFNKEDFVRVVFSSTNITTDRPSGPKYQPAKIKVDGELYELINEGENRYSVEVPVGETAGKISKTIQAVELDNTAIVERFDSVDTKINIEVKAEAPRVRDVLYEHASNSSNINLSFDLVDDNNALVKDEPVTLTVYDITDPSNKTIALAETAIQVGKVEKTITAQAGRVYQALVKASYVLGDNEVYTNETILDLEMDMGDRRYEIKDINEVRLYKKSGDTLTLQSNVSVSEISNNMENYIAQVIPRRQPSFYANILEAVTEGRSIRLTLDYDNVASYHGGSRSTSLVVNYGIITGDTAEGDSFENLIRRMEANPSGTFVLNSDLDASGFKGSASSMFDSNVTFTGTLDGNGHTISNLTKPLFSVLGEGANVMNLIVDKAKIDQGGQFSGTVAREARGAAITNVFVTNAHITSRANHVGGLIGTVNTVTITNVAVTGLVYNAQGHMRLGGIVGSSGNSKINNVYVMGAMSGSGDHIGGIAGSIENNSHINGAISAVEWGLGSGDAKGGIVGIVFGGNSSIKNTFSMIDAEGAQRINGGTDMPADYNNYALITSMSIRKNEKEVRDNEITDRFFKTMLNLDQNSWLIKGTSKAKLPILMGGDPRGAGVAGSTATDGVYIPDFEVVKQLGNYEKSKDILYSNLYKLMPFYESRDLLVDGAKIPVSHILNTNKIQGIIPYGDMVDGKEVAIVGMSKQEPDKIRYIKVVFEDDTVKKFTLNYKSTSGNDNTIANYEIPELRIGYNYDKYLVDTDSSLYRDTLALVKATNYQRDLNPLTPEDETRNYYENFDRWMGKAGGPERFTLNLLANNPEYNAIYGDIANAGLAAKSALNRDNQLKKLLYTYNYFDRFYDIEIGGVNMRDVVFFDGRLFSNALNSVNMTELMMGKTLTYDKNNNASCERFTWNTVQFYNNTIMGYTGKSLGDFLEYYMVNIVTEEEYEKNAAAYRAETGQEPDKANAWMHSNFNGYIYEAPAEDFKDIEAAARGEARKLLEYRAWFHLKRMYSGNYILPFLTYDRDKQYDKDLYLVTYPTALMYGNMRLYWDWTNPPSKEVRDKKIKEFTDRAAKLYNTAGHILNDRTFEVLHNRTDINHDSTRNAYKEDMVGKTEEPVYKYINEVQNQWHRHNSAAAYANTVGGVFYAFYYTLNSYDIWTHENIHNQDGYMYLEGTGKRHSEPENFTDGILTQGTDNALPVPNFSADYDWEKNIAANQTTDRLVSTIDSEGNIITGRERYATWYKNAYEAMRLLEYLEGKAFISLTPEEQSALAYQTTYTNKDQNPVIITTTKSKISAEEFRNYNIKDFADLFDYRITLERGWERGSWGNGVVVNSYWFIPTNDTNTITNESFKRNAHEMSAEGGYDGFVAWTGGAYKNDLDALRGITGIPNNTWRDHQINKYKNIEDKLFADDSNFDGEALIAWIKEGLEADAAKEDLSPYSNGYTNREILYTHLKRITNDFETSIFDAVAPVKITSEDQFVSEISKNPLGIYELEEDLNFDGISGGDNAYISNTFFGELKGNNHTISGLTKPLFNKVMYATVKDLKIDGAEISGSGEHNGALMNYGFLASVSNIEAQNITLSGTGNDGGLIGYIERCHIEGIEVSGVNVTSTKTQTGGVIGIATYSTLRDIHVNPLDGVENAVNGVDRVGGLFGFINKCYVIEECSSIAAVTGTGNAVGGLIGQPENSKIKDCYALGTVRGNRHTGGLVGWSQAPDISNCFTRVDVIANGASGGLIGRMNTEGKLENSISYSNATNNGTYKFDGETPNGNIDAGYRNNYEYLGARGASTLNRGGIEWDGKVNEATQENIENPNFYSTTLSWDTENVWDVTSVDQGGLPKLKSSRDVKEVKEVIKTTEINTIEDFLAINNNPSGIYRLTDNLDFTDVTVETASYITGNFTGAIDGNGYTISNMNKMIFGNLNGADIKNLWIDNLHVTTFIDYGIAQNINNSKITGLHVSNSYLKPGNYGEIGLLSKFTQNSTIEKSSFTNIEVTGRTIVGGLVGQMKSGTIVRDVYISGKIASTGGGQSGPIAGKFYGESIDRVICNVELSGNAGNGGIVGEKGSAGTIKNSLSLSCGTGKTVVGNDILTGVDNVYQSTEGGLTRQAWSGITDITADEIRLLSREFYTETMKFDPSVWELDGEINPVTGPVLKGMSMPVPGLQSDIDESEDMEEPEEPEVPEVPEEPEVPEVPEVPEATEGSKVPETLDAPEENTPPLTSEVVEISAASDLLLMVENPEGEFVLTSNIDLSGLENSEEAYLPGEFSGILNGGGFELLNMTKPLFSSLKNAKIMNLKINAPIISAEGEKVGVIAREASKTVFEGIEIWDLSVTGLNYVGAVVGEILYGVDFKAIKLSGSVISTATDSELELKVGEVTGSYGIGSTIEDMDINVDIILSFVTEPEGKKEV